MFLIFIRLIFINFIIFSQAKKVYVCSVDEPLANQLVQFRNDLLCNYDEYSYEYKFNHSMYAEYFMDTIIVLHDGKWNQIVEAISQLSEQKFLFIEKANLDINLQTFCHIVRFTIFITITDFEVAFLQKTPSNNKNCFETNLIENTFQYKLLSSCPNSLWISGDGMCNSNLRNLGQKYLTYEDDTDLLRNNDFAETYLNGKYLRLGMIINPPFLMRFTNGSYTGIVANLLEKISENLKFNYTIHFPADFEYGIINENGNWTGLMGDLLNNVTDIIFSDLSTSGLRSQYVDFTAPFYFESYAIAIRPQYENKLLRIFSLFKLEAWLIISATLATSTIFLYILHNFAPLSMERDVISIGECFWCIFSYSIGQGNQRYFKTSAITSFMACLLIAAFVILATYSGGLTAKLTVNRQKLPFKDLAGLAEAVERGQYKVCVHGKGSVIETAIMEGTGSYGPLRNFILNNPSYMKARPGCIQLLINDNNVALIEEVIHIERMQLEYCNICTLVLLDEKFFPVYFSFGLPKYSPLNHLFSQQLINALQSGLIQKWKNDFLTNSNSFCEGPMTHKVLTADSNDLTLAEFTGPFLIFSIGYLAAFLKLLFEMKTTNLFAFFISKRYFKNSVAYSE